MKNYFELLGLPLSPRIDAADLRRQYFAMQRRFHPDNATNAKMRLEFVQISADINTAYNMLKNAELRIYYLLKLRGVDILAENGAVAPAVLMEAMELREEALEAESEAQKQQFVDKIKVMRADLLEQAIATLLANDLKSATNHAIRLRYISKIT